MESGLHAIAVGIELADVGRAAVLARDAAGAPALVFAHEGDAAVPTAMQVLRTHAHLTAQPWLLERMFGHRLPATSSSGLRVLVVGHRVDALTLSTFASLGVPDLMVFELHEWSVAGQRHCAVRAVLARPERPELAFAAPSATPQSSVALASEVMTWLERLDADVTVETDRFARRVRARGRALCTLAVVGGELRLDLPDGGHTVLHGREDAAAAMDAVMTRFVASLLPPATGAATPPQPGGADDAGDDGDLALLRRSVADVRVTRLEADALQLGDSLS